MKEKAVEQAVISSFFWKTGSAQDIGSRAQQQDNLGAVNGSFRGKPALLAVLADGMGGMHDGAQFSQIAVDSHIRFFQSALDSFNSPSEVLIFLAQQANREANAIYNVEKPGGTTLISVLITEGGCNMLSIGDSRVSLFRGGKPLQLNREHVLGRSLDERAWMGLVSFEDAEGNIYRDSLISSVGEKKIKRMDLMENSLHLMSGDKIALLSDGIYRGISETELAEIMKDAPGKAADTVVQRVLEKKIKDQDNMSILIIEMI